MTEETTIFVTPKDPQNRLAMDELRRRLAVTTMEEWDFEQETELRCHTQFQTFEDQKSFIYSVKKIVNDMKDSDQISGVIDIETEGGPLRVLRCDMEDGCDDPVTHIDEKGFIYCQHHGDRRKMSMRCRKLKSSEIKQLQKGKRIAKY